MAFFTSSAALTAFFLLILLHLHGGNSQKFVDSYYVELALNLEYLETEFFLYGALGYGLDKASPGLSMGGPKAYGATEANLLFGFPRPLLNISASNLADFVDAAFGQHLNPRFDPYANDINFLIASYVIPYVGLTGYVGAAPNLQTATFKKRGIPSVPVDRQFKELLDREACTVDTIVGDTPSIQSAPQLFESIKCSNLAGLLGVESGQDAVIRALLNQFANFQVMPYSFTVADFTAKISAQRDRLGNPGVTKDEGLIVDTKTGAEGKISGNVLAGNTESLAYDRSPEEILSIVYTTGNADAPGGFFPNGAGGNMIGPNFDSKNVFSFGEN
ncbi:ER membrane complex subunit 6 [Castilleja foliolosa]|uniref:ER membrane complex subunit 6 n=1 Tax=Castilleja foliolosa TaxID=1961234 RepID=A0ABD3BJ09_9LAMI